MDTLHSIALGFSVVSTPLNLFYCFLGVLIGTLIGVLPGIGTAGSVAILLPFTFGLPPVTAIILLAGIWYGAMYGGSTTSILVNIPGEASSVVTCIDGYQMAKQGRAGRALGISAIGSFIAGTFSVVLLMLTAPIVARYSVKFGPPELFSLIFLGLTMSAYLSSGSMIKSFIMVALGMILGTMGIDTVSGVQRFTFGMNELYEGVGLIPIVMGIFGVGEILINVEEIAEREVFNVRIKGLLPDLNDMKASFGPIMRGTFLGFFLGVLPATGTLIGTFVSYIVEKRLSKHPEKFGKGAIEGVAGPESANNSASSGTFVPLLTFGIPTTATMALILGALLIHGITPGPLLIQQHPDVFWGIIVSMYIGNVMLLVLNLPLIGLWVRLLKVPYRILFPLILFFCVLGVFSNQSSLMDINLMVIFGFVGYVARKTGFECAPLVFAYVLSPLWEESFRQSLLMSHGDLTMFFTRPVPAVLLFITFLFIASSIVFSRRRKRFLQQLGPADS
ncbi:MAG: tripartite tricarboxylate transporter permease [Deltaproteobacteria bacterium]|nr:tripartite tricarboxylate transporter permease [Deltaproteobacteria bacterium]